MIPFLARRHKGPILDLQASDLFDQNTFYASFLADLRHCKYEAVIESPFITTNRAGSLLPTFKKMRSRGIRIVLNTRHPREHTAPYDTQAWLAIDTLQSLGVEVLFTGGHHRKLAIIDRTILWEGSLNILSQNDSCEIMRRSKSAALATQIIKFTGINKFL
jgi:hypothetical protein